jgi:hypothetical protein
MILIFIHTGVSTEKQADGSGNWLQKGVYVDYAFQSGGVHLYNGTIIEFNNTTSIYRWECIAQNESTAELSISLNGTLSDGIIVLIKNDVFIDISSRSVYLENGTLIGTTHLWLPANPLPNELITLLDVPPNKVEMTIINREEYAQTCQGIQKTFTVSGMATGLKNIGASGNMSYLIMCDFDTGVMVDWGVHMGDNEGTLKALGVMGLMVQGIFSLISTNIDLGPSYHLPVNSSANSAILLILPFPIIFCAIFLAIYISKKKSRKK